jgi:NAD(P)-dependent dehydrogenase (short-subunit alcohol dehydrogenase family)
VRSELTKIQNHNGLRGGARRIASRVVNPGGRPNDATLRAAVAGKVVLVTGASHGIGRATGTALAGAGATVLLVARSADVLEQLAEELRAGGGRAHAYPADLTDLERIPELAERLLAGHGPPDVVVSNAGKSIRRSLDDSYERFHDFTRTIGINYLGPVRLLLALLPAMRARGSGHVVNVSTIGVVVPPAARWSAYTASKAAFDVWLRSMAAETHADGVTATSIYMALVHTRMSAPTDDFRFVPGLRPEEAAGLVARAIVERRSAITPWWATGSALLGLLARGPSEALVRRYDQILPGARGAAKRERA